MYGGRAPKEELCNKVYIDVRMYVFHTLVDLTCLVINQKKLFNLTCHFAREGNFTQVKLWRKHFLKHGRSYRKSPSMDAEFLIFYHNNGIAKLPSFWEIWLTNRTFTRGSYLKIIRTYSVTREDYGNLVTTLTPMLIKLYQSDYGLLQSCDVECYLICLCSD